MITILQEGEGYSEHFLISLADGIRRAEDAAQGGDADIWDLNDETVSDGGLTDQDFNTFAVDPLDGVLEMMSQNPAAATSYLDVDNPDGNLFYLIEQRDWEVVNTRGESD